MSMTGFLIHLEPDLIQTQHWTRPHIFLSQNLTQTRKSEDKTKRKKKKKITEDNWKINRLGREKGPPIFLVWGETGH